MLLPGGIIESSNHTCTAISVAVCVWTGGLGLAPEAREPPDRDHEADRQRGRDRGARDAVPPARGRAAQARVDDERRVLAHVPNGRKKKKTKKVKKVKKEKEYGQAAIVRQVNGVPS